MSLYNALDILKLIDINMSIFYFLPKKQLKLICRFLNLNPSNTSGCCSTNMGNSQTTRNATLSHITPIAIVGCMHPLHTVSVLWTGEVPLCPPAGVAYILPDELTSTANDTTTNR